MANTADRIMAAAEVAAIEGFTPEDLDTAPQTSSSCGKCGRSFGDLEDFALHLSECTAEPETAPVQDIDDADATELEKMVFTEIHARLTDYMLNQIRGRKKPWEQLDDLDQRTLIDQVGYEAASIVRQAVKLLTKHEFPAVSGTLVSVAAKDGIKVAVDVSRGAKDRYELLDRVGQEVQVVLADADVFMQDPVKTKPEPAQAEMFDEKAQEAPADTSVTYLGDTTTSRPPHPADETPNNDTERELL